MRLCKRVCVYVWKEGQQTVSSSRVTTIWQLGEVLCHRVCGLLLYRQVPCVRRLSCPRPPCVPEGGACTD